MLQMTPAERVSIFWLVYIFVIPVLLFVTSSCYWYYSYLYYSSKCLERCKCQHMKAFVVDIVLVPYLNPVVYYPGYFRLVTYYMMKLS